MLSLLFFSLGVLTGWFVARSGEAVRRMWPTILRVQIFITAMVLTGVAVWRVNGLAQLSQRFLLSASLLVPFGGVLLARGRRSTGEVALEAWSVSANSG